MYRASFSINISAAVMAVSVLACSQAFAAAVVVSSSGLVVADQGQGVSKVQVGSRLQDGTLLLVGKRGKAVIRYDDGRLATITNGQELLVEGVGKQGDLRNVVGESLLSGAGPDVSEYRAQLEPSAGAGLLGGLSAPVILGGVLVVGGATALIVSQNDDSSP